MNILTKLISGGLIVQILIAISVLISSRLYTPQDFGELAWYMSFASIFSIVAALRLDYLALGTNVVNRSNFFHNAVVVNIIILALLFIIISIISKIWVFEHSLWTLFTFCLGFSLFNLLNQSFILNKSYNRFILTKIIQTLLQIFLVLLFYYVIENNAGLILANIVPQLILGTIFIIYTIRSSKLNLEQFKNFFQRNYTEGLKNSLLTFTQYATPLSPVLFGTYLYDQTQIGAYFLFSQAIAAPFTLFRRNLLTYFNAEYGAESKARLDFKKFFSSKLIFFTILLFLSGLIFLYFFGESIILLAFGTGWSNFFWLLIILFTYFFFDAILQPLTTLLPLWGYVNKALYFEIFRFILVMIVLPLIAYFYHIEFSVFMIIFVFFMTFIYILISIYLYKLIV